MNFEDYLDKIRKGYELLDSQGSSNDQVLKSCVAADAEAVRIALEYNESLILGMLV